jgi:sugar phosphate permease
MKNSLLRSGTGTAATLLFRKRRYWVVAMLCIANAICYADRTNIGIAAPSFVPGEGDRGIVLSAFFYGYLLTQIPASYLASQHGVKAVFGTGVLVWTLCDVSTVAVSHSIPLLCLVRAGMGCGEGVVMPSLHRFAASWFPEHETSTLVAIVSSGSDLGTITALLVSPWIASTTGRWQSIFLCFGVLSLLWLMLYRKQMAGTPEEDPRISRHERDFIVSSRKSSSSSSSRRSSERDNNVPWRVLLTNRHLWVIYVAHSSFNYSWYVLLGWLPTYFSQHLGLDLKQNAYLAATPYICGYVGLLVSGKVSDHLICKRGLRTFYVRRLMNSIASFVPALCLFKLQHANDPATAVFLLSVALFCGRTSTSGFWISMIDVGPNNAGQIMGVSNTIATVPGILGNLVTGYILQQTNSWNAVFCVAAGVSVVGGIVFLLGSTDENVFAKQSGSSSSNNNDDDDDDDGNDDEKEV